MAFRHDIKPCGFNPEYRPGFGVAMSRKYKILCEKNPGLTRLIRKRVRRLMGDIIINDFPTTKELGTYNPGYWKDV